MEYTTTDDIYGKSPKKNMSKLRWVRQSKGFSIKKLAEATGINFRTLKAYEYGERDFSKAQVCIVYRIATVLDVPMEQIVDITAEGTADK